MIRGLPVPYCRRLARLVLPTLLLLPSLLHAQLEAPSTGGAVAVAQELRMLGHDKRVLMIGAHPDDEDTELLTLLVRGLGVEAAYLSLNRGEGGQNLIGPELGEGLGILRTEELLAARRLDGARQYFTRAYDFGFSKNLTDTWAHWPKDSVLKDVVRIVRRFRPQVIVSIFHGTPADGHGQHQAAGWAAQEAFRVAGDPSRFPELATEEHLEAWSPAKLYRNARFDTTGTNLRLDSGALDEVVGQTYHQIAMRGRSLHRSQDMGQLQGMGASESRLVLWVDRTGAGQGGLFAGVDTVLGPLAGRQGGSGSDGAPFAAALERYVSLVGSLQHPAAPLSSRELADRLRQAGGTLDQVQSACAQSNCLRGELGTALADQRRHLDRALISAAGLLVDDLADDDRVVPGSVLNSTLTVRNAGGDTAWVCPAQDAMRADSGAKPVRLLPGEATGWSVSYRPGLNQPLSQPYFLERPRLGDLYSWPPASEEHLPGVPFERPMQSGVVLLYGRSDSCGAGALAVRETSLRTNDQSRGEVRHPIWLVPRVDVTLDPASLAWPLTPGSPRRFSVTLISNSRDSTTGTVGLEVPPGWTAPEPRPFTLDHEQQRITQVFELRPPAGAAPGVVQLRAVASDRAGHRYDVGQVTVDYAHIHPRVLLQPALARVTLAPIALPKVARIGYIRGAADRVPEALAGAGFPIELLGRDALEKGDLSRYSAIVIGPRAYETDTALVRNNARLLAYARAGGLVLIQYQQHIWFNGGFAPFPVTVGGQPLRMTSDSGPGSKNLPAGPPISHDRVTDETAPVRLLDPRSPLFQSPNRISGSDWDGWIQERGLYFARSWSSDWKPALETHDPGEAPLEGGLLVARMGKGTFVYTGLSFFRQLPAGVPGAFRLFANLLALAGPAPGGATP